MQIRWQQNIAGSLLDVQISDVQMIVQCANFKCADMQIIEIFY